MIRKIAVLIVIVLCTFIHADEGFGTVGGITIGQEQPILGAEIGIYYEYLDRLRNGVSFGTSFIHGFSLGTFMDYQIHNLLLRIEINGSFRNINSQYGLGIDFKIDKNTSFAVLSKYQVELHKFENRENIEWLIRAENWFKGFSIDFQLYTQNH
jgi:hypothetical protein